MAIIGIDLGTTNSLVCICQDDHVKLVPNPLGQVLTPSVVSVEEDRASKWVLWQKNGWYLIRRPQPLLLNGIWGPVSR